MACSPSEALARGRSPCAAAQCETELAILLGLDPGSQYSCVSTSGDALRAGTARAPTAFPWTADGPRPQRLNTKLSSQFFWVSIPAPQYSCVSTSGDVLRAGTARAPTAFPWTAHGPRPQRLNTKLSSQFFWVSILGSPILLRLHFRRRAASGDRSRSEAVALRLINC